jgi:hypothetical protein
VAIANGYAGIDLYDWRKDAWVGRIRLVGVSRDVAFAPDTAYVATGRHGVQVADLRDPSKPVVTTALTSTLPALAVARVGSMLLAGRQGGDVLAYDATVPLTPTLLAEIPGTPNVVRFEVRGNQVFALSGSGKLHRLEADLDRWDRVPRLVATLPVSRYGLGLSWTKRGLGIASGPDGAQRWADPAEVISQLDLKGGGPVMALASAEGVEVAGVGAAGILWWPTALPRAFLPALHRR